MSKVAIDLGWTHDPTHDLDSDPRYEVPSRNSLRCPDGWEWRGEPGEAPRCGAVHPAPASDRYGSCGAPPGHEHPHVWLRYGHQLVNITRRTRVEGVTS